VLAGAVRRQGELRLLARLLDRIERERFRSPLLEELRAKLDVDGRPPSQCVAALARLVEIHESRGNMIFAPIASLLLAGTQLAFAMERWRRGSGAAVPDWLLVVGSFEALASLAARAYERPAEIFAEIVEGPPAFEAEALGHPLLAERLCVTNDLRLGDALQLLLVSGSNMSGKSTLLRTVGVQAVLAQAGGTVRARKLRLTPLVVGASLNVRDSLQEGSSHFYAEIRRLRQLIDLGGDGRPLLFLLDEVLHGTNSHDRRVGAEALIRELLARGAIGLVTTHDLALARLAGELEPAATNVHFEDQVRAGRLAFDYRLKPGVVRKSNALELMRSVGLDV
jgi:DNA mismatch repair ATPase MutS